MIQVHGSLVATAITTASPMVPHCHALLYRGLMRLHTDITTLHSRLEFDGKLKPPSKMPGADVECEVV
jgi:hypothetical protein